MLVLALEPLVVVDAVLGIATIVLSVWLSYVANRAARIDRLEDTLSNKQEELITVKVAAATSPLKAEIDHMAADVKSILDRLEVGNEEFKNIGEKRESLTLQMTREFGSLQLFMEKNFASKQDLKDHEKSVSHKLEGLETKTTAISTQMAVMAGKHP